MDIKCVVCGEPWDSYGVRHGDMLPWEAKLFRQGAGCPCCKGESNGFAPETLSDLENGDEDPIIRLHAWEDHEKGLAPKWERPCDPEHWACDGCGVRVVTNLDTDELEYDVRWGSKAHGWYHSHPFHNGTPEKEPAHTFDSGLKVCEFCHTSCECCGGSLASNVDFGDTYDEGNPFPDPRDPYHSHVCIDCLDEAEQEAANDTWRTCYSDSERLAYIRDNWSQFDSCHAKYARDKCEAWRRLLANVRGREFCGYASELLG